MRATVEHVNRFLEMCMSYYLENHQIGSTVFGFDIIKGRHSLTMILSNPLNIAYVNDRGCILGEVCQPWFDETVFARSFIIYVKPEYRNGLVARGLLREFEREAKDRGAKFILHEIWNTSHAEVAKNLFSKLGYKTVGGNYTKEVSEKWIC